MTLRKLEKSDMPAILALEAENAPDESLYSRHDDVSLSFIFDNPSWCGAYGMFDGEKLIAWGSFWSHWSHKGIPEEGGYTPSAH